MASERHWYIAQLVTDAEMRGADVALEAGIQAVLIDLGFVGVYSGFTVVQHAGTPNLTVDIAAGLGYTPLGERVRTATTVTLNCAFDYLGASTTVPTVGHSRILDVYAVFDRVPSDPRIDGTNNTIYFVQDEGYGFDVVQGSDAVSPSPPSPLADGILLARITLAYGATQILNGSIDTTVRSTPSSLYGGSGAWADGSTIPAGTWESGLDAIVTALTSTTTAHSGADKINVGQDNSLSPTLAAQTLFARLQALRLAANLSYAGGSAWANGAVNNGPTPVETQLDQMISDLSSSSTAGRGTGGAKVGVAAQGNFVGLNVDAQLRELSQTTASDDGAKRIKTQTSGALAGSTARAQLDELDVRAPKVWGRLATDGFGNGSVVRGNGIASVTVDHTTITVTFTTPFGTANYAPFAFDLTGSGLLYVPTSITGSAVQFQAFGASTPLNVANRVDPHDNPLPFSFMALY